MIQEKNTMFPHAAKHNSFTYNNEEPAIEALPTPSNRREYDEEPAMEALPTPSNRRGLGTNRNSR